MLVTVMILMIMMMIRHFCLKVRTLPDTVNLAVKLLLCPKVKLPHMQREIYNPSCLSYCTDLCGTRYWHNFWFAVTMILFKVQTCMQFEPHGLFQRHFAG